MRTEVGGRIRLRALSAVVAALACAVSVLGGAHVGPAEAATPARVTDVRVVSPTVTGSTASLTVRWDRAGRASGYQVLWSRSRRMTDPRVASTRTRSLTVRRLRQNVTYCFQVRGVSGRTKGRRSAVVCRLTPRRVGQAGAVWMSKQVVEGTGTAATTTLTVRWPRVGGATSYELDYRLGRTVQAPGKVTRKGISGETAIVRGLRPGQVYCFQVRGRNSAGYGYRSPTHCKFTMPAGRRAAASPSATVVDVGSFNACSDACPGWSTRAPKVRDRILAMNVGVMAMQEAGSATDYLDRNLPGYTKACQVGAGRAEADHWDSQSLFVRDADYTVVPGTANGVRFAAKTHGACWVEVIDRSTGRRLVVASVHLLNGKGDAEDRERYAQTGTLLGRIDAQYQNQPGGMPSLVLAGDFNSHRSRAFDGPRVRLEARRFHDGYDVAASYDSPPWQNSASGWLAVPVSSWTWGVHIDRVFAPAGAHVRSWRIVEPMSGGRYTQLLSDHSPVRVSIQLR
ncbi:MULTISPECIES: fibronectin type III domain-containing protein [Nocardioides]|uniref:Fibronectin type III domain-containing protein n=1 Tax=Nocardioides vastitatis TaxID=2568655 RepID=A0ABW0ZJ34_9ACTN|nr:fibronectin type III domain-containing protein [Nocardioides sp.]THJ14188.1 hypothetical protein E7Z54_01380 [Nocardioides sp.]